MARTRRVATALLVCLAVCAGLLVTSASPASAFTGTASDAEAQFAQLLNQYRNQNGLGSLAVTPGLSDQARSWSANMSGSQTLAHDGNLAGETQQIVPDWTRVGENVGFGSDVGQLNNAFINSPAHRANMLGDYNQTGIGVELNGGTIWVTFRFVKGTIPIPRDSTPPTSKINPTPPATQNNSVFTIGWAGSDNGTKVQQFTVAVRDGNSPWAYWYTNLRPQNVAGPDANGFGTFYGLPGHTYTFKSLATDGAGNSSWSPEASTTVSQSAPDPNPFGRAYIANAFGDVGAESSPPVGGTPSWPWPVLRGFASRPGGGAYAVDAYGGVYPAGGAPRLANTPYWFGQDIARGIVMNDDGNGGYVLDDWGGIHAIGNATPVKGTGYWPGQDVARGIMLLNSSTTASPAGYVMDAWGGLHRFGAAPAVPDAPYWYGWAMARSVVANPNGVGGYTLDGWGGVHAWGGAPDVSVSGYWYGKDVARGLAMYATTSGPKGYVLDSWGGVHPVSGAPRVTGTRYWPGSDNARFITISS